MKANHLAELIDLVADAAMNGDIKVERAAELNAALWDLATKCDEREEVHAILQARSEAEMDMAMIHGQGRLGARCPEGEWSCFHLPSVTCENCAHLRRPAFQPHEYGCEYLPSPHDHARECWQWLRAMTGPETQGTP